MPFWYILPCCGFWAKFYGWRLEGTPERVLGLILTAARVDEDYSDYSVFVSGNGLLSHNRSVIIISVRESRYFDWLIR